MPIDEVKEAVAQGEPGWREMVRRHEGLVKPDIVFFGEQLPSRFIQCLQRDFGECDLLLVMGTSLVVQPFASLIDRPRPGTPRLLINRERVGEGGGGPFGGGGFQFDEPGTPTSTLDPDPTPDPDPNPTTPTRTPTRPQPQLDPNPNPNPKPDPYPAPAPTPTPTKPSA